MSGAAWECTNAGWKMNARIAFWQRPFGKAIRYVLLIPTCLITFLVFELIVVMIMSWAQANHDIVMLLGGGVSFGMVIGFTLLGFLVLSFVAPNERVGIFLFGLVYVPWQVIAANAAFSDGGTLQGIIAVAFILSYIGVAIYAYMDDAKEEGEESDYVNQLGIEE